MLNKVALVEIERIARDEAAKGWDERRLYMARLRIGEGVASWLAGLYGGGQGPMGMDIG
jgi:anaphase-promoting complex subunit 2